MSIYSELLRLALEQDLDADKEDVGMLAARLADRRVQLGRSRSEVGPSGSRAAEWTADLIAHDVVIVRLSERLGIAQALTDPAAAPTERDRLLAVLAERVNLEAVESKSREKRA